MLLTVCDNAGNVERSRRFVIFDDTNSVEITGHVGRTLAVDGSVSGRSGDWLTSTQDQANDGQNVSHYYADVNFRFIFTLYKCVACTMRLAICSDIYFEKRTSNIINTNPDYKTQSYMGH